MHLRHSLLLVATLVGTAGCPTRDKYDRVPTVRITAPTNTVYTNGHVTITAAPDPDLDLPIVLRLDGMTALKALESPVYSYDWDTTVVPEGSHTVVAEVTFSNGIAMSNAVTIVVDRQPPTIVMLSPKPAATDVVLRSPIQVFFSEQVVLSQPANATFTLSVVGGSTVATHVSLDQGRVATITIDDVNALSLPTILQGAIVATITDLAGNPLTPPANNWRWDVPDFIKLPQTPLCSDAITIRQLPMFAVGSDLKPVLAWAAGTATPNGTQCQLRVGKYEGGQWTDFAPPATDSNSAIGGAAFALDGNDRAFLAWRPPSAPDPGEIDVFSWNGSAWDALPPIVPSAGVLFPVVYSTMRVGRDQQPILLWGAGTQADRYLMARRTATSWDGNFGSIPVTSQQPFDGPHFDMILADDGNPIISWINPVNEGHVSMWNGNSWSPAPDVPGMLEPFLALDSTRSPMVVAGGSGSFVVQHLVAGNTWQLLAPTSVPPQARHPRIATGPDGLPVIAWFDAQTTTVGMGRWTGQSWNTRAFAFGANALDDTPRLVVDRYGSAWIGWRDNIGQFNLWMPNF